ncbi:caspase family protein [Micromonospora sp. NPDC051196]|uniref:caspase, EACC1-associated type n=1 Tax=Micromonospora sp. NPDC051196 TaxID=3155281 RepID=UPI00343ADC21
MTADRRYRALLLGNWEFPREPAVLRNLAGPATDVVRLREVLTNPDCGLHRPEDVVVRTNLEISPMREEIEMFLGEGEPGDQLLLYYSGHGWKEDDGELYLCARDTTRRAIQSTTMSAATLARQAEASRASAKIVVLDCCNSGNYRFKGPASGRVFDGKGVAALTSSQPDLPSRDAAVLGQPSQFTGHLIAGLGGAATGRDGFLLLDDLYDYVHQRMRVEGAIRPTYRNKLIGLVALGRTRTVRNVEAEHGPRRLHEALRLEPANRAAAKRLLRRLSDEGGGWGVLAGMRLGDLATADGDDVTAAEAYAMVVEAGDPRWAAEAACRRGARLAAMGDAGRAAQAWRQAIEFDDPPWSPLAARELGRLLCDDPATTSVGLGYYSQALAGLDDPGLMLEAGDALRNASRHDEARALYRRLAGRRDPPWPSIGAERLSGLPPPWPPLSDDSHPPTSAR